MRILVTGSSGLIGSNIIRLLNHKFDFLGLDIIENKHFSNLNTIIDDALNIKDVVSKIDNIDAILHLAANAPVTTPWEKALKNNIVVTHNIFEAAKIKGITKVVFASSNHVVGNFEFDLPYSDIINGNYNKLSPGGYKLIDHTVPIRPDSQYGISKAFGEASGRYYHEHFGLNVTCLRIGTFNVANKPTDIRSFSTWISHRDLSNMIELSLKKSEKFNIFYGVSDNTWKIWDIEYAREVIGYNPISNAEDYR